MIRYVLIAAALTNGGPVDAKEKFRLQYLIGAWSHGANYTERPDGTRFEQFPGQKGMLILMPDGHYIHGLVAGNLPVVASGRLNALTDKEALALAQGSLTHFGRWTADKRAGTFTVTIERSSFPNFDGHKQVRQVIELTPTRLSYFNLLSSAGDGAKVYVELSKISK